MEAACLVRYGLCGKRIKKIIVDLFAIFFPSLVPKTIKAIPRIAPKQNRSNNNLFLRPQIPYH
jgi:hypothetical protein